MGGAVRGRSLAPSRLEDEIDAWRVTSSSGVAIVVAHLATVTSSVGSSPGNNQVEYDPSCG